MKTTLAVGFVLVLTMLSLFDLSCGRKKDVQPASAIDTLDISNITEDPREAKRIARFNADRLLPDSSDTLPLTNKDIILSWNQLVKLLGENQAEVYALNQAIGIVKAMYDVENYLSVQVVQFSTPRHAYSFFNERRPTDLPSAEVGEESYQQQGRLVFRRKEYIVTLSTLGTDKSATSTLHRVAEYVDHRAQAETKYPDKKN